MGHFTYDQAAAYILGIGLLFAIVEYFMPSPGHVLAVVGIVTVLILRWVAYAYGSRD